MASTSARNALINGFLAYILWGCLPLYWRFLSSVDAAVVVSHRLLWSTAFLAAPVLLTAKYRRQLKLPLRELLRYAASAMALGVNWFLYVWSIDHQHLIASSLGYFLAPLFYIAVGIFLHSEDRSTIKMIALLFGLCAPVPLLFESDLMTILLALSLGGSIVIYGLLRRSGGLTAIPSLFLESLLLCPIGAAVLYADSLNSSEAFAYDSSTWIFLVLSGLVTLVPLLCYGIAVSGLPFSTLGFLQYISPCLQFLIAAFVFREHLSTGRVAAFSLVVLSLLVLSLMALRSGSKRSNKNLAVVPCLDEP